MLYHVKMEVDIPYELRVQKEEFNKLIQEEKEYAQELQRQNKWVHLWRITGEYANISIFEVNDHDELHALLKNLPLFPYLKILVTPLSIHPSAING